MFDRLKNKTWLVTMPIALGTVAYVWLLFLPAQREVAAMGTDIQNKLAFAMTADKLRAEIRSAQAEQAEIETYVADWQGPSSSSADLAQVFSRLADAMRDAGVEATRFTPDSRTSLAQMQRVSVRIGCRGSYSQLLQLLAAWERLPARIWVEDLNIHHGSDATAKLECEANLAIFAVNSDQTE
ncbi:MAG: type 4a pilus biogenesis protein PilO [Planctomycetes bacterium]|nr:type 4a pilus biogenesis protein PilO [Planctomycetota bacterium]